MSGDEVAFGYVLHNLATGQDLSAETEAEALAATQAFSGEEDWSLWKLRRDGQGDSELVGVGSGPAGQA